jgi:hypothetical protein
MSETSAVGSAGQHRNTRDQPVILKPFWPFTTAKMLVVKTMVLLLLTLLIKARVQIVAGSALGIFPLLLQTLVFLAISGGLVLAAGRAAFYATQQRRSAAS